MNNTFKTPKGTVLPIRDIHGKDYMDISCRIVWFREEHPDWGIETQIVDGGFTQGYAVVYAQVTDGDRVIATAYDVCTKEMFSDFIQKADTSSVGRALRNAGYGTPNEIGDEVPEKLADAPIESQRPRADKGPFGKEVLRNYAPQSSNKGTPANDAGSYAFTFGKHKGLTLAQVYDISPDYLEWLVTQSTPKGQNAKDAIPLVNEFLKEKLKVKKPGYEEPPLPTDEELAFLPEQETTLDLPF